MKERVKETYVETKVEALEGNRARVTVTIDEATISGDLKKKYKEVAKQYNFPGFRRGKAPRPVIDSALGKDYVRALVTDDVVNESFPLAIDETGIYPVGEPKMDEDSQLVEDGSAYTYSFEVDTKPTFELNSYDPVEIELPSDGVTESEIDDEIDAMLQHYMDVVDCPANTKVKTDNYVEMKVSATDDNGDDIASTQYAIGSGLYPSTFDDELIGMKKGESKQFTIDMPTEPTAMTATLMGKTAKINFDVEIIVVKKSKLPELNDEWVQRRIGVDTVEEFRNEIREEILSQKKAIIPRLKETRVLSQLAERVTDEIPESLAEETEATLLQDFFNQLQRQGLTLDAYLQQQGITSQQFRDDVKAQAVDMAKQDLALDAFAAHEGIEATDEDILKEFQDSGASDPEALMEEWRTSGRMHLVRQGVLRQKAVDAILEAAIVTEEAVEEEPKKAGKHAKSSKKEKAAEASEELEFVDDVVEEA